MFLRFPLKANRLFGCLCFALTMTSSIAAAQTTSGGPDQLSTMFSWWNKAMATPGSFTEQAFSVYFTDDAPLIIDGIEVMRGPAGWADRFK